MSAPEPQNPKDEQVKQSLVLALSLVGLACLPVVLVFLLAFLSPCFEKGEGGCWFLPFTQPHAPKQEPAIERDNTVSLEDLKKWRSEGPSPTVAERLEMGGEFTTDEIERLRKEGAFFTQQGTGAPGMTGFEIVTRSKGSYFSKDNYLLVDYLNGKHVLKKMLDLDPDFSGNADLIGYQDVDGVSAMIMRLSLGGSKVEGDVLPDHREKYIAYPTLFNAKPKTLFAIESHKILGDETHPAITRITIGERNYELNVVDTSAAEAVAASGPRDIEIQLLKMHSDANGDELSSTMQVINVPAQFDNDMVLIDRVTPVSISNEEVFDKWPWLVRFYYGSHAFDLDMSTSEPTLKEIEPPGVE